MSSLLPNRPAESSASPTAGAAGPAGGSFRKDINAAYDSGVMIFPSACAASFAAAAGDVFAPSTVLNHGIAPASFCWPVAQATVAMISGSLSPWSAASIGLALSFTIRPIVITARRRTSGCADFTMRPSSASSKVRVSSSLRSVAMSSMSAGDSARRFCAESGTVTRAISARTLSQRFMR